MTWLYTVLTDRLGWLWRRVRQEADVLPLLRPVTPYAGPELLSPLAAIGVLIALAATTGIALASLGVLLLSLLVLHFLVSEVLGITVEIKPVSV